MIDSSVNNTVCISVHGKTDQEHSTIYEEKYTYIFVAINKYFLTHFAKGFIRLIEDIRRQVEDKRKVAEKLRTQQSSWS